MFHKHTRSASLYQKLQSRRGAALLEVIISILIFSAATLGFYQMVFVAVSINRAAGTSDAALENQRLIAESYGTYRPGAINGQPQQLKVSSGGITKTITVFLYGADADAPISYRLP